MKKQSFPILIILTALFVAFIFGFFLGKNYTPDSATLSIPASMQTLPKETSEAETKETIPSPVLSFPIDITRAGKEEFMALPGIGDTLAERIVSYRKSHGGFSRMEDLLNVEGMGKKRFEAILDYIIIGG